MVTYAEKVGYKRFMWNLRYAKGEKASKKRRDFVEQSAGLLTCLREREAGIRAVHNINVYHTSMPVVCGAEARRIGSALDTQVWYDPEGALQEAQKLKEQVEQGYPSLATKLGAQIQLVH